MCLEDPLLTHLHMHKQPPRRNKILRCQQDALSAAQERQADQPNFLSHIGHCPFTSGQIACDFFVQGLVEHCNLPSHQVRCDRNSPTCRNCDRLGVKCPGYSDIPVLSQKDGSRQRIQDSVDTIYRASGVEKRKVGSCDECRRTKSRCSRSRPVCRRCMKKGFICKYNPKYDAAVARSSAPALMAGQDHVLTATASSTRSGSVSTPGSQRGNSSVSLSMPLSHDFQWYEWLPGSRIATEMTAERREERSKLTKSLLSSTGFSRIHYHKMRFAYEHWPISSLIGSQLFVAWASSTNQLSTRHWTEAPSMKTLGRL